MFSIHARPICGVASYAVVTRISESMPFLEIVQAFASSPHGRFVGFGSGFLISIIASAVFIEDRIFTLVGPTKIRISCKKLVSQGQPAAPLSALDFNNHLQQFSFFVGEQPISIFSLGTFSNFLSLIFI